MHASTQTEELLKQCVKGKTATRFGRFILAFISFYYSVDPNINKMQTLNVGEKR